MGSTEIEDNLTTQDLYNYYVSSHLIIHHRRMQLTPYKCLQVLYVLLLKVPGALAFFLVVNIMRVLAPDLAFRLLKQKLETTGTWKFAEKVTSAEDIEYIFSFSTVKETYFTGIANAMKEAQRGFAAPNPELYDLNTRKVVSLLSRSRAGRPLVVNFGSCS